MKGKWLLVTWLALGLLLTLVVGISLAQDQAPSGQAGAVGSTPLNTGFTYQGQLKKDGVQVTDECSMAFRLYDAASGDTLVGSPISTTVPITDGLFAVNLDFGSAVFAEDARWLGIKVSCPGDEGYDDLGRQPVTAAPYALYALSAPWDGLEGVPHGFADGVDDAAIVVSGTAYHAGDGLNQVSNGNIVTLSAEFGGSGTAKSVARSDHDHDGTYSPLGHTHPGSDITSAVATATLALSATQAPWAGLTGVPPGFADNMDDTGLADLRAGQGLARTSLGDAVTLTVSFAGTGSAPTAARSDHSHGGTYWSLTGNTGTTPGTHFLGTLDNQDLVIKTHADEALRVDTSGHVGIGTDEPQATLDVSGTLRLSGTLDMRGYRVSQVGYPEAAGDAVTKEYVDSLEAKLDESRLTEVSNGVLDNEEDVSWDIGSPVALLDMGTAVSQLVVADDGSMLDIDVRATIIHPHPETLRLQLVYYLPGEGTPSEELTLFEGSDCEGTCPTLAEPAYCDGPTPDPACQEREFDWPDIDTIESGSLDLFLRTDPSGTWELWIIDSCETYPGASPEGTQYLTEFGLDYKLWSSATVSVNGDMLLDGSLGIGTTTPQSALQVVGGYIQFPTVSGEPPAEDCASAEHAGRAVVRTDGPPDLYICDGASWIGK